MGYLLVVGGGLFIVAGLSGLFNQTLKPRDLFAGIAICGILVWFGMSIIDATPSPSPSTKTVRVEHDTAEAWTVCQQFVERRLKSPASAKWAAGFNDFTTHLGNGRYQAKAWVDSQNAFGAMLRTNFECTVAHVKGDDWRLETLNFR